MIRLRPRLSLFALGCLGGWCLVPVVTGIAQQVGVPGDAVAKYSSNLPMFTEADLVREFGVDSPAHLRFQLQRVCMQFTTGETETVAAQMAELRQKAVPLLNDGRPLEQQSEALRSLRSDLMCAGEQLALVSGDNNMAIQSATEHLKLLAVYQEPDARDREVRTTHFLVLGLTRAQRSIECIPWLRNIVTMLKTKEITSSDAVAGDLTKLASEARALHLMEEAGYLAERAEKLIESSKTMDCRARVTGLTQIGMVRMEQGKLQDAEAVLLKGRKVAEEEKADARTMADVLNTLGTVQKRISQTKADKKRLAQAEKCFEEAYDVVRKTAGSTPEAVFFHVSNLADVRSMQGNAKEGLKMLKAAWGMMEKELGPNHDYTLRMLSQYAQVASSMGRHTEALKLFQDFLQRSLAVSGSLHPHVAEAQHLLGSAHTRLGQFDEAEKCYERAAGIRERALGTEHADTAKSYFNLGLVREARQDYAGAAAYFEHVLKIDRKAQGEESEAVAEVTGTLARTLIKARRFDEALAHVNAHIDLVEKRFGEEHPIMCVSLITLAEVQKGRERFAEAEQIYQKVIAIRVKIHGINDVLVADVRARFAMFLASRENFAMAAEQMCAAVLGIVRHGKPKGANSRELRVYLDRYREILANLQHDERIIQKHVRSLEAGVDPMAGKSGAS